MMGYELSVNLQQTRTFFKMAPLACVHCKANRSSGVQWLVFLEAPLLQLCGSCLPLQLLQDLTPSQLFCLQPDVLILLS
jgi:hypothetical protein